MCSGAVSARAASPAQDRTMEFGRPHRTRRQTHMCEHGPHQRILSAMRRERLLAKCMGWMANFGTDPKHAWRPGVHLRAGVPERSRSNRTLCHLWTRVAFLCNAASERPRPQRSTSLSAGLLPCCQRYDPRREIGNGNGRVCDGSNRNAMSLGLSTQKG